MQRPLIPRSEYLLCEGAALALWAAMILRMLWNYLVMGQLRLLPSQEFWPALLLAAIYTAGSLLPRRTAMPVLTIIGLLSWLAAVTMAAALTWLLALRNLWWEVPMLKAPYPGWLLITAGVVLLAGIIIRLRARRRAMIVTLSRGVERTLSWAEEQPFYCRLPVRHVLRSRGWDC